MHLTIGESAYHNRANRPYLQSSGSAYSSSMVALLRWGDAMTGGGKWWRPCLSVMGRYKGACSPS